MNQDDVNKKAVKAVAWYRAHKKLAEFTAVFIAGIIIGSIIS